MSMKKIIPILAIVFLTMVCCHRSKSVPDNKYSKRVEVDEFDDDFSDILNDSFVVVYDQPINGYRVKAVVKLCFDDFWDVLCADLTFTKHGKSFTLHTRCFGDSAFSKGKLVFDNGKVLRKNKNKIFNVKYYDYRHQKEPMPIYSPFFFKDMDFDGIEELVIVHHTLGVRHHNGYDVYRIVDGVPVFIDYSPYNDNYRSWRFGMTDYPEFNYKKKTISCPYPEGELTWAGRTIYGVSKKQKDTVVVNGKKHLFNHMEVIEEIKFDNK